MVNCGLMIGMLMAVGLLFWVPTRHWDHAVTHVGTRQGQTIVSDSA